MDTEDRLKAEAEVKALPENPRRKDFAVTRYGGGSVRIVHLKSGTCVELADEGRAWCQMRRLLADGKTVVFWPPEAHAAFIAADNVLVATGVTMADAPELVKDPPGGIAIEATGRTPEELAANAKAATEERLGIGSNGKLCEWPSGRDVTDPAEDLLKEALRIVTGARRSAYGKPEDNFKTIAELWSTFCRRRGLDFTDPEHGFTAGDTAVMMILLKCARLGESPGHLDSVVDIAGYAACLRRCQVAGGAA